MPVTAAAFLLASLPTAQSQSKKVPTHDKIQAATGALPTTEEPVHLSGAFYLERSPDGFGIRSHGIIERTSSGSKLYSLPHSSFETYKRLHATDPANTLSHVSTAKDYQGLEVIGPYQIEGSRIWFGNQYYDGEGETGVGAFGYFDLETRKYVLFSPPEVAHYEVSALLVQPDAIWLALDQFGEDIGTSPVALVRWDRADHHVRSCSLEFVIHKIRPDTKNPALLLLSTHDGYALFQDGNVKRFRVERSSDGKQRAVPINRFPPPPSIY